MKSVPPNVVIEVEDSCGGLPEGAVKKLFDPFVQLGADRSGFGLGLSMRGSSRQPAIGFPRTASSSAATPKGFVRTTSNPCSGS